MKNKMLIVCFPLLVMLAGCVTLYKPNVVHSPILKEKGEFNTMASLGISGSGLLNAQAAYATSNHMGVMANGMYHFRNTNSNSDGTSGNEELRILSGEAAAGYFTTFGTNKNLLFQCYGGGGYGSISDRISSIDQPNPEVSAKYYNLFIQPGIAFITKNFEVAFDLKANYVSLFDTHAYLYDKFEWWNTDFQFYADTTLNFMNLEPAITMKAGGQKIKGIMQVGVIIPTIHSDAYFAVNNSSMLVVPLFKFSIGVAYSFGKRR